MLWTLPQEVFDLIVDDLRPSDVKALSQVSKSLNSALAPTLWKGIRVDVRSRPEDWSLKDQHRMDAEAMARCAAAFRHPSPATRHATRLTFDCRYRAVDHSRTGCPHFSKRKRDYLLEAFGLRDPDGELMLHPALGLYLAEWEPRRAKFHNIGQNARLVVEGLPEHQLHAFSWDVGACVPPDLIRVLGQRQPQLESLYLATSKTCSGDTEDKVIDLSPFKKLKRIHWRAPPPENLDPLAEAIQNNRCHLERLELALSELEYVGDRLDHTQETRTDLLVDRVLSVTTYQSPEPMFPVLRVLSLTAVPLHERTRRELLRVVHFGALESLSLVKCHNWNFFLEALRNSDLQLRLKALELKCDDSGDGDRPVAEFVQSFEGLEELYVCVTQLSPTAPLWRAVGRHRGTLKRFVYHKRVPATIPDRGGGLLDPLWDSTTMEIPALGLAAKEQDPEVNPLHSMQLECFGLTGHPAEISWPALLRPFTKNPTLRLLHLRQTGSHKHELGSWFLDAARSGLPCDDLDESVMRAAPHDRLQGILSGPLLDLVNWAFGPEGIPSLQVIACGDFAHGRDPYYLHNMFVCRNGKRGEVRYVVYDSRDEEHRYEWADLVRPYWRVLEACPVGPYAPILRHFF